MPAVNVIHTEIPTGSRNGDVAIVRNRVIAYILSDKTDTFAFQVKFYPNDTWHDLYDTSGQYSLTFAANEAKLISDSTLVGLHSIRAVADGDVTEDTTVTFITVEL